MDWQDRHLPLTETAGRAAAREAAGTDRLFDAVAVREQAVMADSMKAVGQHGMKKRRMNSAAATRMTLSFARPFSR